MSSTNPPSEATAAKKRREIRRPDMNSLYSVNPDGSRNMLHPADVKGRWQTRVQIFWALLIVVYAVLPWIHINGRPAVHLDLPGRQAFLFGLSFTNQDFYLAFFLFTGIGFALFVATALFGRIWCGFACPQTVFMEGIFRRVERWIEGPRNKRLKLSQRAMDFDKFWRKTLKHALFLFFSYVIAHIFLSYFIPVKELMEVVRSSPQEHWSAFGWSMFWTGVLYFDYAWFREQTCLIICPYGRLQSAMQDADTIVIGYDTKRGEPRSHGTDKGGDCVDCFRCVEVCPTGIDIRNGMQMECIGCTRCIDACDDIMRRIDKPEGLVRYDSQRSFSTGERRPLVRPRVLLYVLLGLVGIGVASWRISGREDMEANVLRARGLPYALEETRIRNLVNLHLQNKKDSDVTFQLSPSQDQPDGVEFLISQTSVRLQAMEDTEVPVYIYFPRDTYSGSFPLFLDVVDSASGRVKTVEATFRGP